jgi:P2-related tail formation protein
MPIRETARRATGTTELKPPHDKEMIRQIQESAAQFHQILCPEGHLKLPKTAKKAMILPILAFTLLMAP